MALLSSQATPSRSNKSNLHGTNASLQLLPEDRATQERLGDVGVVDHLLPASLACLLRLIARSFPLVRFDRSLIKPLRRPRPCERRHWGCSAVRAQPRGSCPYCLRLLVASGFQSLQPGLSAHLCSAA